MDKEQLYEQIEAYIDGNMKGEERAAFEAQIQADPELAAELEIQRKLHREFGDPKKNQLILQLEKLGQEYEPRRRTMWPRFLAIAASVVLLLGFGYYYFFVLQPGPTEMPIVEEETPEKKEIPETPKQKEKEETQLAEEKTPVPPKKEEKPTKEEEKIPEVKEEPEELLAFGQNKELEAISDSRPSEEWKVTIYLPEKNVSFLHSPGSFNSFICTGVLKSKLNPDNASFSLQVVDNNKRVIWKKALPLVVPETEEEEMFTFASEQTFPFEANITIDVPPGRYYLMILKDEETTLAARPFIIQE